MQKEFDFANYSSAAAELAQPPEKLLILATETTGLDVKENQCLEIGAILFHVRTRSVLAQNSFLIPAEVNEAEKINKIPAEITQLPQPWEEGMRYFEALVDSADAVLAHNASFDKQWFGQGPLPIINGKTPKMVDKLVIRIGRSLIVAASMIAISNFFPSFLS